MQRPVIYYGLRGVGKTVILNVLEGFAENMEIQYEHIEANEDKLFTRRFSAAVNRILGNLGKKNRVSETLEKCKTLIRSFRMTYEPEDNKFAFEPMEAPMNTSGIYSEDMMQVIVSLGRAAEATKSSVCFFIDEMQYLGEEEVRGLVLGIHRCSQLKLPITLFCAGLPKLLKYVGDTCSYAERLFSFIQVDSLSQEASYEAITNPASDMNVEFTQEALFRIYETTKGYPYFIQEFCSTIWKKLDDNAECVTLDMVDFATKEFYETLDRGFFSVRYDRCTPTEKTFTRAMAQCDKLPCEISKVAEILGKTNKQISPTRGSLISKGIIYATGHGRIDFTVPQFADFLKRNP